MEGSLIILFASVLIIGALVLVVISLKNTGGSSLNVEKYRIKWLAIEQKLKPDDAASHHLCVLNADKLLDQSLRERGFAGNTMGERMKSAQKTWTDANAIWSAHKLRNKIAHDPEVKVDYGDAKLALARFRQALKDVGAI